MEESILIGRSSEGQSVTLPLAMANRHGLITGATGTGKTVTLQILAEGFARSGVPVVVPDIKGDLSGLGAVAQVTSKIEERLKRLSLQDFIPRSYPLLFWRLSKGDGHPLKTTVSEVGPLLLSRILELNEIQTEVLTILFCIADAEGLLLLEIEDLISLVEWASDNHQELRAKYGSLHPNTLAAIQRRIVLFREAQSSSVFSEPGLVLTDLLRTNTEGSGFINLIDAREVIHSSKVYTSFLLWLLSELFEQLPEVGDLPKPKLVFFFDEAHLLFDEAPKALVERIIQVVRLIRSKGVGVYFITQHPSDIPHEVLGQLGHRIQHALRVYTPREERAVKAAVETLPRNPKLDAFKAVTTLAVGEALVSTIGENGIPSLLEHIVVCPPSSKLGPLDETVKQQLIKNSPLAGFYEREVNRESAHETLAARRKEMLSPKAEQKSATSDKVSSEAEQTSTFSKVLSATVSSFVKSALKTLGHNVGRELTRGILGSLTKKR